MGQRRADSACWIGRAIETAGETSAADTISEWPVRQVVVCRIDLETTDARLGLSRLFKACRRARHELLVDLSGAFGPSGTTDDVASAIDDIAGLGVLPDWWVLPAQPGYENWNRLAEHVAGLDPYCHGILIDGSSLDLPALEALHSAVADSPNVSGIVMGPAAYRDVARKWFATELDDEASIAAVRKLISDLTARQSLLASHGAG